MGQVSNNLKQLSMEIEQALEQALEETAQDAEMFARQEADWENDSGSARASITGYNPAISDHSVNFEESDWAEARSPGYISPRWKNPNTNFFPEVMRVQVPDQTSVLTIFVRYAEELHAEQIVMAAADQARGPFINNILKHLNQAVR